MSILQEHKQHDQPSTVANVWGYMRAISPTTTVVTIQQVLLPQPGLISAMATFQFCFSNEEFNVPAA